MKNVLKAIQYNEIKAGTTDVGCLLARLVRLELTGVFLKNVEISAAPPLPEVSNNKSIKAASKRKR